MHDILLSKIAANATENSWSQAYSTINFYVVLSVHNPYPEKSIAVTGKDILEQLQREFFALEEKNLTEIHEAVKRAIQVPEKDLTVSLTFATVVEQILYIIIVNNGAVFMKRKGTVGLIAQGTDNSIQRFSGPLLAQDIVFLVTDGFLQKIPVDTFSHYATSDIITDIAEGITPILHDQSVGTEAALIFQNNHIPSEPSPIQTQHNNNLEEHTEETESTPTEQKDHQTTTKTKRSLPQLPKLKLPSSIHHLNRKIIIMGILVILVGALIFGLVAENGRRESARYQQLLEQVITPAEKDYNDGLALLSVNKQLALDKFRNAQAKILSAKSDFPPGSSQETALNNLQSKIAMQLDGEEQSSATKSMKLLLDGNREKLPTLTFVSYKNDRLTVADKTSSVAIVESSGSISTRFDLDTKGLGGINHDVSFLYLAGDEHILRVDSGNKKDEEITDSSPKLSDVGSIIVYLENVYVLNTDTQDIEKYNNPSYNQTSYFRDKQSFKSPLHSFAIDGSVWILEQSGALHKYTRGIKDTFSINNLTTPIGKNSLVTTDIDYTNLYILDRENSRVVVLEKNGTFSKQISGPQFKSATSLAIDEDGKKGYIISGNNLYSFDL